MSGKDMMQRYQIPDEKYAKYVKVNFLNNKRGGSFVGIRFIEIKGI